MAARALTIRLKQMTCWVLKTSITSYCSHTSRIFGEGNVFDTWENRGCVQIAEFAYVSIRASQAPCKLPQTNARVYF